MNRIVENIIAMAVVTFFLLFWFWITTEFPGLMLYVGFGLFVVCMSQLVLMYWRERKRG